MMIYHTPENSTVPLENWKKGTEVPVWVLTALFTESHYLYASACLY